MNERRKILDQFEDQKIFLDETVPANIEMIGYNAFAGTK